MSALRSCLLYDQFDEGPHNMELICKEAVQKNIPEFTQSLIELLRSLPSIEKFGSLVKALEFVRSLPPTRKNLVTMQLYEKLCDRVRDRPLDLSELLLHALSIDDSLQSSALEQLVGLLPSDVVSALSFILRLPWSAISRHSWLPLGTWLLLYALRRDREEGVLDALEDLLWVNRTLWEKYGGVEGLLSS